MYYHSERNLTEALQRDVHAVKMPKDDEISRGLTLSIRKLQTALQSYESAKIPQENAARLVELRDLLASNVQEISDIVEHSTPGSVENSKDGQPSFSRAKFYSSESPYLNKMDLSKSYRLVPPMKVKKSKPSPTKRVSPSEFLLSSLQLLENITNLQRLHKTSTKGSTLEEKLPNKS